MRLTSTTLQRLHDELAHLDRVLLPAARSAVEDSRGAGDTSQNTDFFLAGEEEASLLRRRETILNTVRAHEAAPVPDGEVAGPGSVVVLDLGDGPEEFLIGSIEERHVGFDVMTPTSPIGSALLGAAAGSEVLTPTGLRVRVLQVRAV